VPLLDELWGVIDHVEAFSSSGSSCEKNLATACNKCNGRKSASPTTEFAKKPKHKPVKGKYGEPQYWEGLSSVFIVLAQRDPTALTATEKGWLKALTKNAEPLASAELIAGLSNGEE